MLWFLFNPLDGKKEADCHFSIEIEGGVFCRMESLVLYSYNFLKYIGVNDQKKVGQNALLFLGYG